MGEVVDLESWRARCGRSAPPPPCEPSVPLPLKIGLAAMLGLPLMVTLAALAA